MDPRLLDYFNRELLYIREMGGEFAREFPKIASRLGLDAFECADPYVERLLEGFAFLAARIHLKLDEEFPKFTDHLFEMVFPHFLAPTPSMAVVQMEPVYDQGSLLEGYKVPRGSALMSLLGPGDQTRCQYRTSQDVVMWPIEIVHASYSSRDAVATRLPAELSGTKAVLRLRLRLPEPHSWQKLAIDRLPIFLRGRDTRSMLLYEQLLSDSGTVVAMWDGPKGAEQVVIKKSLGPMGFEDDQALLPLGPRSFKGYRLLNEYFAFPQRFLFVEASGLQKAVRRCPVREMDLVFPFGRSHARLENVIDHENFGLHCTPAINLFPHIADRIALTNTETEYHVMPDRTRPQDFEVHTINGVTGYSLENEMQQKFRSFYAMNDSDISQGSQSLAYYTLRRTMRQLSSKERRRGPRSSYIGSETYLSIVDANNAPYHPDLTQLNLELMCTNRDLPLTMPVGKLDTDFTLEIGAPIKSIRCLAGPTEPAASFSAMHGDRSWRLISHLSLNYLSLIDSDGHGAETLREMLMLYEDMYAEGNSRQTDGILSVSSKPIVRRISQQGPLTFGRGVEITLNCDESRFEGSGVFLMGAVLADFFNKYVTINSFTQTVLRTVDRGEVMRWPINLGRRQTV